MRPARDRAVDYKRLVRDGYNMCAARYADARASGSASLEPLLQRLTANSEVLDLGCGAGDPVAKALATDHRVTGVDFAPKQIELARRNVPAGTFIQSDIAEIQFEAGRFDAIVMFYVLFHLPRTQQLELLRSIWRWLKPGGYLLGTLSSRNEEPYTEDFFGVEMYWTNYALEEYLDFLGGLGFELLANTVLSFGGDEDHPAESHPLVLVQKPLEPAAF